MLMFTRSSRILAASVVLLAALAGCSGGGGGSSSSSKSPSASKSPAASHSPTASPSKNAKATITIADFTFKPAHLTVAPGTKVTVVNKDSTTHTVTADKNKSFDTGDIAGGKTTTFTAPSAPGSYSYTCTIHPFMKATLTVK
jgi:plastocyanin